MSKKPESETVESVEVADLTAVTGGTLNTPSPTGSGFHPLHHLAQDVEGRALGVALDHIPLS